MAQRSDLSKLTSDEKDALIYALLAHVEELWRKFPDWRLGQLMCNVAAWSDPAPEAVWDVEDDEVVAQIQKHLQKEVLA